MYDKNWAHVDLKTLPRIRTELPGPKSREYHARAAKYMKGYSSQVTLCPVVFEKGHEVAADLVGEVGGVEEVEGDNSEDGALGVGALEFPGHGRGVFLDLIVAGLRPETVGLDILFRSDAA